MPKPNTNLIPPFYRWYINAVRFEDLILALITGGNATTGLFRTIPEALADYCYVEGKWSIRQVINHMMDAERVFCYRALAFSRNDLTELPGFDENHWAPQANASGRKLSKLIDEYINLRASTVDLFSSFTEEMLDREGTASGVKMNVATLGFLIAGH